MSWTDARSTTNVQKNPGFVLSFFHQTQPCCLERPQQKQLRKSLGNRLTHSTTVCFPPIHALSMITFPPQVNIRVTGEHFLTILGPRTRFKAHFYPFFLIRMISGLTQLFTRSESSPGRLVPWSARSLTWRISPSTSSSGGSTITMFDIMYNTRRNSQKMSQELIKTQKCFQEI